MRCTFTRSRTNTLAGITRKTKINLTFNNESESKHRKIVDYSIIPRLGSMQSIGEIFESALKKITYINIYLAD